MTVKSLLSLLVLLALLFSTLPLPVQADGYPKDAAPFPETAGPNHPPVAGEDFYECPTKRPLRVVAPNVLSNDADPDGDGLRAVLVRRPSHGILAVFNDSGAFLYIPPAHWTGVDTFAYRARDRQADSNVAVVSINVGAANTPPSTSDSTVVTEEDMAKVFISADFPFSDADVGQVLHRVKITSPADAGSLQYNPGSGWMEVLLDQEIASDDIAAAKLRLVPAANASGAPYASFQFKVSDGFAYSATGGTMTVNVLALNDPPVAADDGYTAPARGTLSVNSSAGLLRNDTDPDGDTLAAILVSGPSHGALALNADASFTYAPEVNWSGTDTFTYKANDGQLDSNAATVAVTVTAGMIGNTVQATVDPGQETVITSYSGEMTLTVPAGAVSDPTVIEIAELGSGCSPDSGIVDRFDFKAYRVSDPSAQITEFNKGLSVTVQYDLEEFFGLDADTLAFYSIDDTTDELILNPTSRFDFVTGRLTATVDHFSGGAVKADAITNLSGGTPSFQVGLHSGAAATSYSLQIPPGSGGFQPDLTLTYDTNRVNAMKTRRALGSWVGIGWQLQPGRIVKARIDKKHSGYRLEMNGVGHDLIEGDGGRYYTDPETFFDISRAGETWLLYDRAGNRYRFGSSEESRQDYQDGFGTHYDVWYLDLMEAANGTDRIFITYASVREAKGVRSVWPAEMTYNAGNVRIVFNSSGGRIDLPVRKEFQIEDRRLDSIDMFAGNSLVRRYWLTYEETAPSGEDCAGWFMLRSIEEIGQDGSSILSASEFGYAVKCIAAVKAVQGVDYLCCWPYLETIRNPLGGTVSFEYECTPRIDQAWQLQIISRQTVDAAPAADGDEITTGYVYWGYEEIQSVPWYIPCDPADPWDSVFRGYHRVVETAGAGNDIEHRFAIDLFCSGRERSTVWYEGSLSGGIMLRRQVNSWQFQNIAHGNAQSSFPYLDSIETTECGSSAKTTRVDYDYDIESGGGYGNLVAEYHHGDVSESGDEFTVHRVFYPNSLTHVLSLPARERVYSGIVSADDGGTALKKETLSYYDNAGLQTPPMVGRLTKMEESIGDGGKAITEWTRDTHGNVTSLTDPNGNIATWTYDAAGIFPQTRSLPLVGSETYAYDSETGNLLMLTDINQARTEYRYDSFHRLAKVIRPGDSEDSAAVEYLYHYGDDIPSDQRYVETRTKTDEGQYLWSREYFDGLGRPIQTQQNGDAGAVIVAATVEYDRRGLVGKRYVSQEISGPRDGYKPPEPGWKCSATVYDALGRITSETAADGASVRYDYAEPWVEKITNERGYYKKYRYDAFGQLVKVEEFGNPDNPADKDSLYAATRYTYDVLGNLLSTIDNVGNTTTMAYDQLGRKTRMADPDMGGWHYGYDAAGNLLYQIDAKGQATNFYYDGLNRLKGKTYQIGVVDPHEYHRPDAFRYEVGYTYDEGANGKGRLTGAFAPIAQISDSTPMVGDEDGYREIRDVRDLQNINLNLDADYELMNDINASDTVNWNDGAGFIPIGLEESFSGSFNGNGHNIIGLHINSGGSAGLFAGVGMPDTSAVIRNVNLVNVTIVGLDDVGALAGHINGGQVSIVECSVSGTVTGISHVGGLVGSVYNGTGANVSITGCSVDGNVTGTEITGGLVGWVDMGHFVDCRSNAVVVSSARDVGGFAGGIWGGVFDGCSADGDVSLSDSSSGTAVGVGGFAGVIMGGAITGCRAAGNVILISQLYRVVQAGGFVGEVMPDIGGVSIRQSYATGDVYASTNRSLSGTWVEVGGFAGSLCSGSGVDRLVVDCYARGNATAAAPNRTTGEQAGGFVGMGESYHANAIIDRCYSTGTPSGITSGGFSGVYYIDWGHQESLPADCFWDIETSGTSISRGGTGKITAEMKDPSTFAAVGWDFDSVWNIDSAINGGYPSLRPVIVPQGDVNELVAIPGDRRVKLAWENPANSDFAGVLILRSTDSEPNVVPMTGTTYTVGEIVGNSIVVHAGTGSDGTPGNVSGWADTGLTNGDHYCYKVFAYQNGPRYSQGKTVDAIAGRPQIEASNTFKYDERGHLVEESLTYDGQTYTTGYTYDSADRLKMITYPTLETVSQTYSDRGLPNGLSGNVAEPLVSGVQYNPLGQMNQVAFGSGVQTFYGYYGFDPEAPSGSYGRLWRIRTIGGGSDLQNVTHTWDAGGNLIVRADNLKSQGESFGYDFLDRLKTASGPYSQSYGYDQLGNLIRMTVDGVQNDYSYNPSDKPHAVRNAFGKNYLYDANGNMTTRGDQVITWDIENRPVSVIGPNVDNAFAYDAFGDRLLKTEVNADGQPETVLYVNAYFEKNLTTGEEISHYFLGGQEVAFKKGDALEYVHTDHLGGTSLITDTNGVPIGEAITYLPYGKLRADNSQLTTDKLFTGQRLDQTGLYFYNARYYDAEIGRFISPDTLVPNPADPQHFNRYSYVLNNPLKYTDPSGHWIDTVFDIASAAYDIYTLTRDPGNWSNWAALGADVAGAFIPGFTGGGAMVRSATKADEAVDVGRVGNELFESTLRRVDELDFSTGLDEAVFYSGPGNRQRALDFANIEKKTTIDMTPGGQYLNSLDLYGRLSGQHADQIWAHASARYAQSARGEVNLFVTGANPKRIYRSVEEPILRTSENVSRQVFHP